MTNQFCRHILNGSFDESLKIEYCKNEALPHTSVCLEHATATLMAATIEMLDVRLQQEMMQRDYNIRDAATARDHVVDLAKLLKETREGYGKCDCDGGTQSIKCVWCRIDEYVEVGGSDKVAPVKTGPAGVASPPPQSPTCIKCGYVGCSCDGEVFGGAASSNDTGTFSPKHVMKFLTEFVQACEDVEDPDKDSEWWVPFYNKAHELGGEVDKGKPELGCKEHHHLYCSSCDETPDGDLCSETKCAEYRDELECNVKVLTEKCNKSQKELSACLNLAKPYLVRCFEGGGPESQWGSLALTIGSMIERIEKLEKASKEIIEMQTHAGPV